MFQILLLWLSRQGEGENVTQHAGYILSSFEQHNLLPSIRGAELNTNAARAGLRIEELWGRRGWESFTLQVCYPYKSVFPLIPRIHFRTFLTTVEIVVICVFTVLFVIFMALLTVYLCLYGCVLPACCRWDIIRCHSETQTPLVNYLCHLTWRDEGMLLTNVTRRLFLRDGIRALFWHGWADVS